MNEITHMMCRGGGHGAYVDSYQVGDDWNVDLEIPAAATFLPSHVPPLGKG